MKRNRIRNTGSYQNYKRCASAGRAHKKASLIEAKDEIHKLRSDADKEIRERRSEVQNRKTASTKGKNILIKEQIPLRQK